MLTMFETSKGSTYVVNPDGTTKRYKVPHVGHSQADVGWKESSSLTLYVSTERGAYRLLEGAMDRDIIVIHEEGIRLVYKDSNGNWQWHKLNILYTNTPTVGSTPVEFWGLKEQSYGKTCTKYHIGNAIVSIK